MPSFPTLEAEQQFWNQGHRLIAGVDEVGRGSLAGPVTAAAVIFPQNFSLIPGVNDSKLLSPAKREMLAGRIKSEALTYAVSHISPKTIDHTGILKATLAAMENSIIKLAKAPNAALIDGNTAPKLPKIISTHTLVKGDRTCFSIAAASILAKTERDRLMLRLSRKYPGYYWHQNKGYGTKQHYHAISLLGINRHHRRSFLSKLNFPNSVI